MFTVQNTQYEKYINKLIEMFTSQLNKKFKFYKARTK